MCVDMTLEKVVTIRTRTSPSVDAAAEMFGVAAAQDVHHRRMTLNRDTPHGPQVVAAQRGMGIRSALSVDSRRISTSSCFSNRAQILSKADINSLSSAYSRSTKNLAHPRDQ